MVPITSTLDRVYPSEALVTLRRKRSKAMADQLTTASKRRLSKRLGRLSPRDMQAVDKAIRIQLGLDQVFGPT